MKKIISMMVAGLCCLTLTAAVDSDKTITYKNQRGSTMELTWHAGKDNTGALTGTFTTAVGSCKEAVGKPMPLTGYYNGNAVSVIVNFVGCKDTVAMTGNLSDDNSELTTLWMLAKQAKDPVHANWDSNIVGSDSYKKVAS